MPTIGTVSIQLDGDSARLVRELNKANRQVTRWSRQTAQEVQRLRAGFNTLRRAIAAAFAGGIFVAVVSGANRAIDALAKTSDKLGTTTEALAGLRLAAELTGVASNQLDLGLQRATRRIAEAAQGTGEAQGALRQLGLDAAQLAQLPIDQQFLAIADAMENVTNQSERIRLGFKLFDSEGVALINTLRLGRDGLNEVAQEARDLGIAVSRVDAAKIEIANNAVVKARSGIQGLSNQLAIALAPALKLVSDLFTDFVKEANRSGASNVFVSSLTKSIGFLADGVRGLRVAFLLLKASIAGVFSGVIEGINLAAQAFIRFTAGPLDLLLSGLSLIPGVGKGAAAALELLRNTIDGVNSSIQGTLGEAAQSLANVTVDFLNQANDLALKELPSIAIERRLQAAQEESKKLAAEIAAASNVAQTDSTASGGINIEAIAEAQRQLAQLTQQQAEEAAAARTILESQSREAILRGEQELQSQLTQLIVDEAARRVTAKVEAEAAAREAAGLPAEDVAILDQQKAIADEIIRITQDLARQKTKIEADAVRDRIKVEENYSKAVFSLRQGLFNSAVSLLQAFAGKSRAIAIALIAIEKAQAIARAVMNTAVAVTAALAIDPTGKLAARAKIIGAAQIAVIAATGFAEAAQVGAGGAELGTFANPVYTTDRAAQAGLDANPARDRGAVQIVISGDIYGWDEYIEERVIGAIRDAVDNRDVVLIGSESRNAQEISGSGG